jgi:hypothetical protein
VIGLRRGKGYDETYDFGRYGATWGFMKSKGEGILRVWGNWRAFVAGQTGEGDLKLVRYTTSRETDEAIMADFAAQTAAGEKREGRAGSFEAYKLTDNYELLDNNCTTKSLRAMGAAQGEAGGGFPGYPSFSSENDSRDLYREVKDVKGAGTLVTEIKKGQGQ